MTETTNPGNNANYYTTGYLLGSPYYRTNVGEFELSDSAYGTFDQGGNVWEWNETLISGSYRGVRGGSFNHIDFTLRAVYRNDNDPPFEINTIGFRVASISAVPEPASAVLLALCLCGLSARRRR